MLAAYTELKNAQKVKQLLTKKGILNHDFLPVKELGLMYFPITKRSKISNAKTVDTKFKFPEKESAESVEETLKGKLTVKELKMIPKTQEIVGKIMILEIPEELREKEKIVAEAYLESNRQVETVVKKGDIHTGIYRLRKVKILAGKRSKETIHYENGVKIKLNLEKTYFSARSANERLRIAKLVKPKEKILIMFSGAAPYPLVISKHSEATMVYGVEINPEAYNYAVENVNLNKFEDRITLCLGDVREVLPKIEKKFDRIIMPLPKTGEEFLDIALRKIKKNGMIHLYQFLNEMEINKRGKEISGICKKHKHPVKVIKKVKCGQFSPGTFRVCFDIKVL